MSVQPPKNAVFEEVTIPLGGPLRHDLKLVNTTLFDARASFAVKSRATLEEVAANYTGLRRKCGELYACYTIRTVRHAKH